MYQTGIGLLQVEHPVTEWISGVNIPSCQLMIGMGVPLHRIPDIRRLYGLDPNGDSKIDFDNDPQISPSGLQPCDRPIFALSCSETLWRSCMCAVILESAGFRLAFHLLCVF